MRGSRIALVLVVCVTTMAGAERAAAFHEGLDEFNLAFEQRGGPAWVAMRIEVTDSRAELEVAFVLDEMVTAGSSRITSTHVLDETGRPRFGSYGGGGCGGLGDPDVYVRAGDEDPLIERRSSGCTGLSGEGFGLAVGRYTVVHAFGADADITARFRVFVSDGVTVEAVTSGPAIDAADEEFDAALYAHGRSFSEAQVVVDGVVRMTVENALFGAFWDLSTVPAVLHSEGPSGRRDGGGHFTAGAAGDYSFVVDAKSDANPVFASRVWLLAADVVLP